MAKAKAYFITGTDTNVGKTSVATGLLYAARQAGLQTGAIKPVAAGCQSSADGLRNEDAMALLDQCTLPLAYEQVNPIALEPALAPHIAAQMVGKTLRVSQLAGYCQGMLMSGAEFIVIEGAGGWRVPLNSREYLSDLARELAIPVILVVGMRLGCINHALLTVESIRRDGLYLAAWVANQIDPQMLFYEENLATLQVQIAAPLMGEIPYLISVEPKNVAKCLDMSNLF